MELVKNFLRILLLLILAQCKSTGMDYYKMDSKARDLKDIALSLERLEKKEERYRVIQLLELLYGEDADLQKEIKQIPENIREDLRKIKPLGASRAARVSVDSPIWKRALLYIPDRLLEVFEMTSISINIGPQLRSKLQVSGSLKSGFSLGAYTGFGFGGKEKLFVKSEVDNSFHYILGYEYKKLDKLGLKENLFSEENIKWIGFYTDQTYQESEDYYTIKFSLGFLLIGFDISFHPIEAIDAVSGVVFLDPLNDDLATTRKLDFNIYQNLTINEYKSLLSEMSKENLEEFRKKFGYKEKILPEQKSILE